MIVEMDIPDYIMVNNNAAFEEKHPRDDAGKFTSKYSINNILGEEFFNVKGQDAVNKIMSEHRGFVRDAFYRKDIGNIALLWGNDNIGLQHIIKRRIETKQPLGKLLRSLTEVIEQGELEQDENNDFVIRYKGKKAIIEPKLFDHKIQFLMTAYYEK